METVWFSPVFLIFPVYNSLYYRFLYLLSSLVTYNVQINNINWSELDKWYSVCMVKWVVSLGKSFSNVHAAGDKGRAAMDQQKMDKSDMRVSVWQVLCPSSLFTLCYLGLGFNSQCLVQEKRHVLFTSHETQLLQGLRSTLWIRHYMRMWRRDDTQVDTQWWWQWCAWTRKLSIRI